MKTTLALIAAATLTLGACSTGDEPTKDATTTSTKTAEPTDEATGPEDVEPVEGAWGELDTYDDAYALGQAIGGDYWGEDGTNLDCSKANQEEDQIRDDFTGNRVDVTVLTCSAAGTEEQATLTVAPGYDDETAPDGPVCDEYLEGDTCFTGKGWTVEAWTSGQLVEILEALDVDHEDMGVGY